MPLESATIEELGDDALGEIKEVARKVLGATGSSSLSLGLVYTSAKKHFTMVIDSGRENVAYQVQVPQQDTPKTRQLPVTLLSGFLVGIISSLSTWPSVNRSL
jgi:hypothetical protein